MISWFIALNELSIGECCLDVNRRGLRLPDVICKQTRASYHAVFSALYQISDEDSEFRLNASKLASQTGYSRKTIYQAIAFLKRVNLLRVLEEQTGRGNHSLYQLNWRKGRSEPASKKRPAAGNPTMENSGRKCHPTLLNKSIKRNIHPSGDKMLKNKDQTSNSSTPHLNPNASPQAWRQMMKHFRLILSQSELSKAQGRLAIGVIGRAVKRLKPSQIEKLYRGLNRGIVGMKAADWVRTPEDFCRWFGGVINVTLAEQALKRQRDDKSVRSGYQSASRERSPENEWRAMDANERQWTLIMREKERIADRRGRAAEAVRYEDELRRWADQRRDERRYRALLAERARQRLREGRVHETS